MRATHEVEKYQFDINIDAQNRVYGFDLVGDIEEPAFEKIRELVLDKELNEAQAILTKNIPRQGFLFWLRCLYALKSASGEKVLFIENPKRDQLICRCQGYSMTDLEKILQSKTMTEKEIMVETNIGMTCSQCRPEIKSYYSNVEKRYHLVFGRTYEEWEHEILTHLNTFNDYSDVTLDLNKLSLTELDLPKIKFSYNDHLEENERLQVRLGNYLAGKMALPIEVLLTTFS